MGKLYAFDMITLDGYFEGPGGDISWHRVDDEFNTFAQEQLQGIGVLLFGRRTYDLMASYWPTPAALSDDAEIAGRMNRMLKAVASRTLTQAAVTWENTRLLGSDLAAEVAKLKAEAAGDVAVFGSGELLNALIPLGLVDEYRLMVAPLAIGAGTPLLRTPVDLKLAATRTFGNGNVLLTYTP